MKFLLVLPFDTLLQATSAVVPAVAKSYGGHSKTMADRQDKLRFGVVGIIMLSFATIFNFNASDTSSSSTTSAKASSSSTSGGTAANRFSSTTTTPGQVYRRFNPTKTERPKVMPVTTPKPTIAKEQKTPVVQPKRAVTQTKNPKIYFDSKTVPSLLINWFDDNGKTTDTIKVPTNPNLAVQVPDGINYFNITNNTETLKSDKLRIADKTVYTITCANLSKNNNCLKLQIESSLSAIKRNIPGASDEKQTSKEDSKIPKGAEKILIDNSTGKQLQISWLTKNSKLVSDDKFLTTEQGSKEYEKPEDAAKFQVVRDLSMYSNTIDAIKDNEYEVTCKPSNFFCNQIIIKNIGVNKDAAKNANTETTTPKTSSNALSIYLINTTKNPLQINWYNINKKLLSSEQIANNLNQQKINIVSNAASFTISNKENNISSNSTNQIVNEVYKISCQPISSSNKTCTQITITDNGPLNTFKVTRSAPTASTNKTKSASSTQKSEGASGFSSGSYASSDGGSVDYSAGIANLNTMLPDYSSNGLVAGAGSTSSSNSSGSTDSSASPSSTDASTSSSDSTDSSSTSTSDGSTSS